MEPDALVGFTELANRAPVVWLGGGEAPPANGRVVVRAVPRPRSWNPYRRIRMRAAVAEFHGVVHESAAAQGLG